MRQSQLIAALLGVFAVVLQLVLILQNRVAPIGETLLRFFTFFTILTNIIVAVSMACQYWASQSGLGRYFARAGVQTAIAVYILIVGLIYNVILRFLWEPKGLQMLVDELLHTINPILYMIYWFRFVSRTKIGWSRAFLWMIYPAIYLFVVMWRGSASGYYPYPFWEIDKLGQQFVAYNISGIFFLFLFFSICFILVTKVRGSKSEMA